MGSDRASIINIWYGNLKFLSFHGIKKKRRGIYLLVPHLLWFYVVETNQIQIYIIKDVDI